MIQPTLATLKLSGVKAILWKAGDLMNDHMLVGTTDESQNFNLWQKMQRTFTLKILSSVLIFVLSFIFVLSSCCLGFYYYFDGASSSLEQYQYNTYEYYVENLVGLESLDSDTLIFLFEDYGIISEVSFQGETINFGELDENIEYIEVKFSNEMQKTVGYLCNYSDYPDLSTGDYVVAGYYPSYYSYEDSITTTVVTANAVENETTTEANTYTSDATMTTVVIDDDSDFMIYIDCDATFYIDIENANNYTLRFFESYSEFTYNNINTLWIAVTMSFILLIALVILIVITAGKTRVRKSLLLTFPFDLATLAILIFDYFAIFYFFAEWNISYINIAHLTYYIDNLIWGLIIILGTMMVNLLYLLNLKVKYDALNIVKNMLICKLYKAIKNAFNALRENVKAVITLLVFIAMLSVVEVFIYTISFYIYTFVYVCLCFLFDVLVFALGVYKIKMNHSIEKALNSIADGQYYEYIDTKLMLGHDKRVSEKINNISTTVDEAVNERMKSEYFKTELITNVSHDIKTPLTSIINYSDLICKEQTDNENIKEYSDVLFRQSNRLKKLIEDLLEASKASTGNLKVDLQPCEVATLLSQTIGEYSEKFEEKNLELICTQNDPNIKIQADSRHLFRVFENLLNNTSKYAQANTRVYVTVDKLDDKVHIAIKNVSKDPLNITASELMERFVRGDSSRNSDGNGLGLSIARSLTEIQNGKLELVIDGDLFKAILIFDSFE